MANPPGRSIVLKTPKPTTAQAAQKAAVARTSRLGAPGIGGASTDSLYGFYNRGPVGLAPKPVATDPRGFVRSPVPALNHPTGVAPKPAAKPAAPKVKVVVHQDGRVEVHHASAPAAPATTTPPPAAAPTPAMPAATHSKAPARVPATAAAPAAPAQTVEQQAQSLLDPVKQSILDAINQRVTAQQQAITGYSKDLAQMMGQYAPAAKAIYGGAEAAQGAVDSALGSTLAGQGGAQNDALAAKLAQIEADPATAARLNAAAGANLQGASSAFAAKGAASLSDLIGRGASAQDYGAKLPGVAGLYGLQATKSAQSKATTDTANAVAQLEQQLPNIVQQIKTDTNQNKQLRFEHGVALLQANGGVVTPQIKSLLGGSLPVGLTQKGAQDAAKVKIEQQNAATSAENARVNAAYKQAQLGITETKLRQSIVKEHATAKAKGQHLGLSAKDWQNYNSLALSGARSAHNGTPDGTHPPVSWQQFLTIGLGEKIPIGILIAQGKKAYSQAEIKQGLIPGKK